MNLAQIVQELIVKQIKMKNWYGTILTSFILFSLPVSKVLAQADFGANDLADSGLGTGNVVDIVNNIISIFLGFLAIIAVVLIIYAGWMWMTSQGNADKVQRAKLILTSAVIGLVIILTAYIIVRFVISSMSDATGVGPGNGPGGGDDPGPGPVPSCLQPADDSEIAICQVKPGSGVPGQYITIKGWHFGEYDNLYSRVLFDDVEADLISCNGSPVWEESGTPDYYYIRAIIPPLSPGGYKIHVVNEFDDGVYPSGVGTYQVSNGLPKPSIACITPANPSPGQEINIEGNYFGDDSDIITMQGWVDDNAEEIDFSSITSWENELIIANVPGNALASDLFVTVDSEESNDYYLPVSCVDHVDCASGCCTSDVCRPNSWCGGGGGSNGPQIDYITPDTAAEGNLITIYGSGFGDSQGNGNVWFDHEIEGEQIAGINPSSENSICTDNWHDNYIVIVVPDSVKNDQADVWVETDSAEESNQAIFHDNGSSLPGLCSLEPNGGAFGQSITLHGLNFIDGNKASFGGILDHGTIIDSEIQAQATVPNVAAGELGLSMQSNSGENGNALPFVVDPTAGGNPVITEVSPNQGPVGQYLTIFGANFGNSVGRVTFIHSLGSEEGDFEFPDQCMEDYWHNDHIVVKVPTGLESDNTIKVTRSDGAPSNEYDFTLTTNQPGPGICAIVPDNGPVNFTPVTIYGDNFGNSGIVSFYNNVVATVNSWANQGISAIVPEGAITGPLNVSVAGQDSNPVNFAVGSCSNDSQCSGGQVCCSSFSGNYCAEECPEDNFCEYTWTIKTAAEEFKLRENYQCENGLQSPSPWPDGLNGETSQDAYKNANIVGLFTRNVVDADLLDASNVQLLECTGRDSGCDIIPPIDGVLSIINHNSNSEGFKFNPDEDLAVDTWYKVDLGIFHAQNGGDIWNGSDTGEDYQWHFKTREEQVDCTPISISVTPDDNFEVGEHKNFYASAKDDNCNVCEANYNWSWNVTYNGGLANEYATVQEEVGDRIKLLGVQSTANLDPNNIQVQANLSGLIPDAVNPIITGTKLQIVDYGPNCSQACDNANVWVKFNTPIDQATVIEDNFQISVSESIDPNVSGDIEINPGIDFEDNRKVLLNPVNDFTAKTTYAVTVKPEVANVSGYELGDEFKWDFTVGSGIECAIDRVEVSPSDYFTNNVTPIPYQALPYSAPDSCGANGQLLGGADFDWTWDSSDDNVATISNSITHEAIAIPLDEVNNNYTMISATEDDSLKSAESKLVVNTVEGSGGPNPEQPKVSAYQPVGNGICTNTAMSATFSETMNRSSARLNIKLYYREDDPDLRTPDCQSAYCPVNSRYSFVETETYGTEVIVSPRRVLNPYQTYFGWVSPEVASIAGLRLNPTQYNFDIDNDGNNDSFGWEFKTGADACAVNFVIVEPRQAFFTYPGQTGDFIARAYDIGGNEIVAEDYTWSENKNLLSLVPTDETLKTTANNNNGEGTIRVTASGPGSASGSASFRIFLCENPWPNPYPPVGDVFPFNFKNGIHGFNFNTFYCQDSGRVGESLLPYLTVDPIDQGGSGNLLREFIFVVDPRPEEVAFINNNLATITKDSWWSRFIQRFKAKAQTAPDPPTDLVLIGNTPTAVTIGWTDNSTNETGFKIYRRSDLVNWTEIGDVSDVTEFTDNNVVDGEIYSYRVSAYQDILNDILESEFTNTLQVNVGASSLDVIAVQVRANPEHLSVSDWFSIYAPNPNQTGQQFEVNGYQALQVGNTIYVSAANINGATAYTNIYILTYSIGARESTRQIFDQLIDNVNFSDNINNIGYCIANDTTSCSSDFDCEGADTCRANGDKLRRDTKRLTDLVGIQRKLHTYGQLYQACSVNGNISCQENSDCPSGDCVAYYPLLNSGTYLAGTSITRWPSWQQEFSSQLFSTPMPLDPINRFNGECETGANPDTCWNEAWNEDSDPDTHAFMCPAGSLIYVYDNNGGQNYYLGGQFETSYFSSNLVDPPLTNGSNKIYFSNDSVCNGSAINPSSPPSGSGSCGDGVQNGSPVEECDGGFRNLCDTTPGLGDHNWWRERIGGCYGPGTRNAAGALIECTWYQPDPPLDAYQCGGWCGDGGIQTNYEACEGSGTVTNYSCADDSTPTCTGCQPICDDGNLAIACDDGYWDQARGEECDTSATPDGLTGVSCTDPAGTISCISCRYSCDLGEPYFGYCGNNNIEGEEECEPALYGTPEPADADSPEHQYQCSNQCLITGGWCGDGDINRPYESCDDGIFITPSPGDSSVDNQYNCNTCVNLGGWCGDRIVHDGNNYREDHGEECEDGDEVNDNVCDNGCLWTCNDGICSGSAKLCNYDTDCPQNETCLLDTLPDGSVVEHNFIFNGYASEIAWNSSSTVAVMSLPACRYRGDVLVDVSISGGSYDNLKLNFTTKLCSGSSNSCTDNTDCLAGETCDYFTRGSVPINDGDNVIPADIVLDSADCQKGVSHSVEFNISWDGDPNIVVILSNPRFNFCPWENDGFY